MNRTNFFKKRAEEKAAAKAAEEAAKKAKAEEQRKKTKKAIAALSAIVVLCFGFLFYSNYQSEKKDKALDEYYQQFVIEINHDIENGDYESALEKTKQIDFKSDHPFGNDLKKKWDKTRQDLIKQIEEIEKIEESEQKELEDIKLQERLELYDKCESWFDVCLESATIRSRSYYLIDYADSVMVYCSNKGEYYDVRRVSGNLNSGLYTVRKDGSLSDSYYQYTNSGVYSYDADGNRDNYYSVVSTSPAVRALINHTTFVEDYPTRESLRGD